MNEALTVMGGPAHEMTLKTIIYDVFPVCVSDEMPETITGLSVSKF